MISPDLIQQFHRLRNSLFMAIKNALEEDGHSKHYEGLFDLQIVFPSYFDRESGPVYWITLHCYVIGPGRHHTWKGNSFQEALTKCRKDVEAWMAEDRLLSADAAQEKE